MDISLSSEEVRDAVTTFIWKKYGKKLDVLLENNFPSLAIRVADDIFEGQDLLEECRCKHSVSEVSDYTVTVQFNASDRVKVLRIISTFISKPLLDVSKLVDASSAKFTIRRYGLTNQIVVDIFKQQGVIPLSVRITGGPKDVFYHELIIHKSDLSDFHQKAFVAQIVAELTKAPRSTVFKNMQNNVVRIGLVTHDDHEPTLDDINNRLNEIQRKMKVMDQLVCTSILLKNPLEHYREYTGPYAGPAVG